MDILRWRLVVLSDLPDESTSSPGTDVDTGYGQLLRRMTEDDADATFVLLRALPGTDAERTVVL